MVNLEKLLKESIYRRLGPKNENSRRETIVIMTSSQDSTKTGNSSSIIDSWLFLAGF